MMKTNLTTLDAMAASWTTLSDGLLVDAQPVYTEAMQANCSSFRVVRLGISFIITPRRACLISACRLTTSTRDGQKRRD
ncbi:uncharacterized protein TrAtP1_001598 [Trichoderma atroviride]|uniref:uncharacterized protein n=1 Tax=Hypocrea atroviridis TaxID=63577 RepID=UPI00332707C0|nr:hypothetical protein TrAtP1_001598 [Trichoderma atroviride]